MVETTQIIMTPKDNIKTPVVKSCRNCEQRKGISCLYSGYYCSVTKQHPTPNKCGSSYEGWSLRKGILTRIKEYFI